MRQTDTFCCLVLLHSEEFVLLNFKLNKFTDRIKGIHRKHVKDYIDCLFF